MSLTTDYKSNFDSELYLKTVYDQEEIGDFTAIQMKWFHEAFSSGEIKGKQLLDVGTGPTIHSVISASSHVEEIYLSDYTPRNLDILRSWWKGERKYLKAVFEYVMSLENKGPEMDDRNNVIRSKVKGIIPIDITSEEPLRNDTKNIVPLTYDIVTSSFTVESASSSINDYKKNLKNLLSLVKDGGYLVLLGSTGTWYRVGSYRFPKPYTTVDVVCELIKNNNFKILKQDDFVKSGYEIPQYSHVQTDNTNFFLFVTQKLKHVK